MRKLSFLLAVVFVVSLVRLAEPFPHRGSYLTSVKVQPGEKPTVIEERFRGGERACVILEGDHDPVMDVYVEVYDEQNRRVAFDHAGGDICAVVWYPPRDGKYRIEVSLEKNAGIWNRVRVVAR
jgi:hypothetical protein